MTASGSPANPAAVSPATAAPPEATANCLKATAAEVQNPKLEELVQERRVLEEQRKIDELKRGQNVDQ
jgi:hypothetical protein